MPSPLRPLKSIGSTGRDRPPYCCYPLAEIGRRGKTDIPPRQALIDQLYREGFTATHTHLSTEAIRRLPRLPSVYNWLSKWHSDRSYRNKRFIP